MAFDGNGNYTLPLAPVVAGTAILDTWANTTLADVASALTLTLKRDGQGGPIANISFNGFRALNVADGQSLNEWATVNQLNNNSAGYIATVSGTNILTATITRSITAYAAGQSFTFIVPNTITGAATININSLGAKSITKNGSTALAAGDMVAGEICYIEYDGTRFQKIDSVSPTALQNALNLIATVSLNAASVTGALSVGANATVSGTLGVTGAVALASTLTVAGLSALNGGSTTTTPTLFDSSTKIATTAFVQNSNAAIQGDFKNLKINTVGVNNFSSVVTADSVLLSNAAGQYYSLRSVSGTASIAASGLNGLDTGTSTANTWYYVFVIFNQTTLAQGTLLSVSATAPTLPSGYTFFARVGVVRTDSSANKYLLQTLQLGRQVQYVVLAASNTAAMPTLSSGAVGNVSTPTWASVSTSGFNPPTASKILLVLFNAGNGTVAMAAPNASYGAYNNQTNPPPICIATFTNEPGNQFISSIILESSNIYYASTGANASLLVTGWEDNL
jgi:hypothetical protein